MYEITTHWMSAMRRPNAVVIAGKAMFTAESSGPSMAPRETITMPNAARAGPG